ncbi:protein kinase [candidate division KSB1 bacterium]|nr:protein kinase [candidate division KSB1 bacterium]
MKKIGKYEIRATIGEGGMGIVYKAFDPFLKRDVAIKVISETLFAKGEVKERFLREAQSAAKLSHENITTVYDLGESRRKPYIVLEYLTGKDLRSIIHNREPIKLSQKLNYIKQICKGLEYSHGKNLIHRDIKPENIRVLEDGKVKIMDFGLARPEASTMTQTGAVIGTPHYMSPEQIKGKKVDKQSDIFSFGVLFYEFLTYKKPFEGDNNITLLFKIVNDEPERLSLKEDELVNDLQAIISKCLAKDAQARYESFSRIIAELQKVVLKIEKEGAKDSLLEGQSPLKQQKVNETTENSEKEKLLRTITILTERSKSYFNEKQYDQALKILNELSAIDSEREETGKLILQVKTAKKTDELLHTGQELKQQGQYQQAIDKFNEILALDSEHSSARELLEQTQKLLEEQQQAMELSKQKTKLVDDYLKELLSEAAAYFHEEKFSQAVKSYKRVLELDPNNREATAGIKKAEKASELKAEPPAEEVTLSASPSGRRVRQKALWIGLTTLFLIVVLGTWVVFQKINSGSDDALLGSAEAAKQEMLILLKEAEEVNAKSLAKEAFGDGEGNQQFADTAFLAGDFGTAVQSYNAATDNFRKSIEDAKRNAKAAKADLSELKNIVAEVRKQMLTAKKAAETKDAPTIAKKLYAGAFAKEKEATKSFNNGDRNSLMIAQRHFAVARDLYQNAGVEAEINILKEEAAEAKATLSEVIKQVPATDTLKINQKLRDALSVELTGDQQLALGDYPAARNSYLQAKVSYVDLSDQVQSIFESKATAVRDSVLEARKAMVKNPFVKGSEEELLFRNTTSIESEATKAFNEGNFDRAAQLYQIVLAQYGEITNKLLVSEQEKEIQTLIDRFEQYIVQDKIKKLKELYANKKPSNVIIAKMQKTDQPIKAGFKLLKKPTLSNDTAEVLLSGSIEYWESFFSPSLTVIVGEKTTRLSKRNLKITWTCKKINGEWLISKENIQESR